MQYYYPFTRMAKMKKRDRCWHACGATGISSTTDEQCKLVYHFINLFGSTIKI